jgi:probable F420-dependent oxidoreductase
MKIGVLPLFNRDVICNPDWVAEFIATVEEENVESVWGVEHVLVAENYAPNYPYSADGRAPVAADTVMPDPLEWLAFAAALSRKVVLGTSVMVLPQHSPVQLAKRLATIDRLSNGRMLLGAGLGWQQEEYAALNVPFAKRGARMDEYIAAMRALWAQQPASFEGEFVRFSRVFSDVRPVQAGGIPIIIGGSTEAAARRAGRIGDGFYPYVISPEDMALRIDDAYAAADAAGRARAAVEFTIWPGSWQFRSSLDADVMRRYLALPISRVVVGMHEAEQPDFDGLRTLLRRTRETIATVRGKS